MAPPLRKPSSRYLAFKVDIRLRISDCLQFLRYRADQRNESGGSSPNKELRHSKLPQTTPSQATLLNVGRVGHQKSNLRRKSEKWQNRVAKAERTRP